jgi:hypothetical protein
MASNKSTVIFLPGGSSKVRKISIPNRLIPLLSFFTVVAIVIIGLLVNDYRRIKSQIPELQHLRKESEIQKTQLIALSKEIQQSNQKIAALQEFDHKLRIMTNLQPSGEQDQFLGVGGSNMSTLKPDYQLEDVHSGLIHQMHEAIDFEHGNSDDRPFSKRVEPVSGRAEIPLGLYAFSCTNERLVFIGVWIQDLPVYQQTRVS